MERNSIEPVELARFIINLIEEKKAEDIVLLDIRNLSVIADYFVICTGGSERQLKTILDNIRQEVKKNYGISPRSLEGETSSGWVLIDFIDVIVHAFSAEARSYYDLEGLWAEAPVLLKMK